MSEDITPLIPLHEREEFRKMRDALAEQLASVLAYANDGAIYDDNAALEADARKYALKIAPILYNVIETQCLVWQGNAVQGARGMMLALNRIEQLDTVRYAVETWRESAAISYLLEHHPNNLSPSERGLARAIDEYNETRNKDN